MSSIPYHDARASLARPPMVRFTLVLDEPRCVFAPGDRITGRIIVVGSPSGSAPPQDISVNLFGRAKCKLSRRGPTTIGYPTQGRRSRAALVSVSQSIESQSMWLEAEYNQTASSPFSITVPNSTQRLNLGNRNAPITYWDEFEATNGFAGSIEHPLPPSLEITHMELGSWVEALVEYHLSATVIIHGTRHNIASGIPVRVAPVAPAPEVLATVEHLYSASASIHTIKSLRLLPENSGRDLTFKENAKHFFKSSSLPSFQYKIQVLLRHNICVGDPLKMDIRMQPVDPTDPKIRVPPRIPPVTLKHISIKLRSRDAFRTIGAWSDDIEYHDRGLWSEQRALDTDFELEQGYGKSYTMGVLPIHIPPTFVTCNIQVRYVAEIKVTTPCAGEVQTTRCQLAPRLLGRRRSSKQPVDGDRTSSNIAPRHTAGQLAELAGSNVSELSTGHISQLPTSHMSELPAHSLGELPAGEYVLRQTEASSATGADNNTSVAVA